MLNPQMLLCHDVALPRPVLAMAFTPACGMLRLHSCAEQTLLPTWAWRSVVYFVYLKSGDATVMVRCSTPHNLPSRQAPQYLALSMHMPCYRLQHGLDWRLSSLRHHVAECIYTSDAVVVALESPVTLRLRHVTSAKRDVWLNHLTVSRIGADLVYPSVAADFRAVADVYDSTPHKNAGPQSLSRVRNSLEGSERASCGLTSRRY